MDYRRTFWSKPVRDTIVKPVVDKRKPLIHNYHDFGEALRNAPDGLTIFASHRNGSDVPLLDHTIDYITGGQTYPVFLMRHNLRMIPGLPAVASRFLARTILREAIFIDQSDTQSLRNNASEINSVYQQQHPFVVFPGATRDEHYINGLIPDSVSLYHALLKRTLKKQNPYFTVATISYENDETHIVIGETKPFFDFSMRDIGEHVLETMAEQLNISTDGIPTKEEITEKIKSR